MNAWEVIGGDHGVEIEVRRLTASRVGPTVAVLGGVHGDELEGVLACAMLADGIDRILSGELVIVPRSNPSATQARMRESPNDGKNLARCFPGSPDGTYTDRIAHVLTNEVIARADALIDLHAGGEKYAMPFFAGYIGGLPSSQLAATMVAEFGAPVWWSHDSVNEGRTLSAAAALDVPAMYVEGGSGGRSLHHRDVDGYVNGVRRVLGSMGILAPSDGAPPERQVFIDGGDGNTDASIATTHPGYCVSAVAAGDRVAPGQMIAEIRDRHGRLLVTITSPTNGIVMMIRTVATVDAGDAIVMIAGLAKSGTDA